MTPTESASGKREGPLPSETPTDSEHIAYAPAAHTPLANDDALTALLAQLKHRTNREDTTNE